ncbi:sel1 repeat family protein [Shewanella sp. Isolate13]|uniref:tetratricopeptide repeat protein n=1 Tax=Shewanella sp. Isolate13 TaxID=2908531 RepID=UPI001EFCF8AB|nr:tetratricopeptide repeat protein [Shewanella sp. Isolate13]MCG9732351.1 sel1 repeat family protein [Shewanella sp. Isolate13]
MRILSLATLITLVLTGCSALQPVELAPKVSAPIFDPWCNYAVAGLADSVSQKCIDNAAQGDVNAATNLGYLYAKGILVELDKKRAMAFYRIAAKKGMPEAQYSLAEMYRGGVAGLADPKLARYWYEQLANSHSLAEHQQPLRYQDEAQFMLGLMDMDGIGAEQNLSLALKWLKLSSGNGHSEAPYVLGNLYLDEYNQPQQALDWYLLSAERGFAPAMHQLGMGYIKGVFGDVDAVKGKQWLRQAAALGLAEAQVDIATLEYNGFNGEPDLIKIYVWLDAASHQGNEMAKQRLKLISARLSELQLQQAEAISRRCIESQFQNCQTSQ